MPGIGGSGPVETRSRSMGRNERAQGRRMSQLRRSASGEHSVRTGASGQLPTFERDFIGSELRRIVITTSALLAVLIALTFILR